jgi:hypothetical protein
MAAEPFTVPEIKNQIGWRLTEQDKKNLRLLMADRRETNYSKLLRELVEREAAATRVRWLRTARRIAGMEDADG